LANKNGSLPYSKLTQEFKRKTEEKCLSKLQAYLKQRRTNTRRVQNRVETNPTPSKRRLTAKDAKTWIRDSPGLFQANRPEMIGQHGQILVKNAFECGEISIHLKSENITKLKREQKDYGLSMVDASNTMQ
jgi:hypothetical protein